MMLYLTDSAQFAEFPNFHDYEFRCRCGCGLLCMAYCVLIGCQTLRNHFGVPCYPTSGNRCERHNANSNGAIHSQHLFGRAVDLVVPGVPVHDLAAAGMALIPAFRDGGIIQYPHRGFIHFDVRPHGPYRDVR